MHASLLRRSAAELVGTFVLVLGGVGSIVIGAALSSGIGPLGVGLAFGLSVVAVGYSFGPISGAHFNPAVTIALAVAGRIPARLVPAYVLAQLAGAILATFAIYALASGKAGFDLQASGLGANGYGAHSPQGYGTYACLLAEVLLSFVFVLVVLGANDPKAPKGFGPLAIGVTLALVHLVGIPLTTTSVNPARSTGPALIVGGWALRQLWLFWVAPIAGGLLATAAYALVIRERPSR